MRLTTAGVAVRKGKYFIALRKPGTSIGESWEFPGGKNRTGETPEETLIREYLEEFNVDISVGNRIFTGKFINKGEEYELAAYCITFLTDNFQLFEHQQLKWAPPALCEKLPMAESDKSILNYLNNRSR